MNETELANYISQKMAELGIEIVREEESELSETATRWRQLAAAVQSTDSRSVCPKLRLQRTRKRWLR